MSSWIKTFAKFGAAVLLLVGLAGLVISYFTYENRSEPREYYDFSILQGESFKSVSMRLHNEGLIRSEPFFYYLGRLTGKSGELKAGEYELNSHMSAWEILRVVTGSRTKLYRLTVPEGSNMFQVAQILDEAGLVDQVQFLETCWDQDLLDELSIPSFTVEGYLFPETYFVSRGSHSKNIIRMFVEMFWSRVPEEYLQDVKKQDISFHEAVILASMIEKETGLAGEMGLISAVFYNRLETGMRLQSDPTAVYDLLPYGGRVQRKHLFRKTPFNTYQIKSIPLTPIANPGILAIHAAIYPQDNDYIYFVSRKDGSHHFSKTYAEHKRAINKYLK